MLLMIYINVYKILWLYVVLVLGFIFYSVDIFNFVVICVSFGK